MEMYCTSRACFSTFSLLWSMPSETGFAVFCRFYFCFFCFIWLIQGRRVASWMVSAELRRHAIATRWLRRSTIKMHGVRNRKLSSHFEEFGPSVSRAQEQFPQINGKQNLDYPEYFGGLKAKVAAIFWTNSW
jgi:hypothetical protein